jgi:amino acid adenylation domain-containing protein
MDTVSYAELIARASRLASYLVFLGVGPDVPVALCLERSFDLITSALAVLMAGGAYLPLDPAWPPARTVQILEQADALFVIARGGNAAIVSGEERRVVDLDVVQHLVDRLDPLPEPVSVSRENLAYIIFTSGSTGQPKGVEVTHGNLLNLIFWHRRFFDITHEDRASHIAGIAFDAAVWETWPHLTAGAALVLADDEVRTSAELLRNWLIQERITVSFVPTALAEAILSDHWPAGSALRYLLTGGDTLHRTPSASFPLTVFNNYGPTECTVVATSGAVTPAGADLAPPSIGKPIAHTRVYILDRDRNPVKPGETGEIYIGGAGVARGYRNNPSETQERFIPDPFSLTPAARLYRTGDLGSFLPDGQIAFCGRADAQVELRGNRIEPDEIVSVLNTHPSVRASAVAVHGECCSKRLVAYVVRSEGAEVSASDLRNFVSERLPHFMVPASFCELPALPLNFNGKLDRNALPGPSSENLIRDRNYRAPNSPMEEELGRMLAGLLGVDEVGPDENFFLLGFHSLLATQVAGRVHERFAVQLTPRHLFEAKTVARLAAEVDRQLELRIASLSDEEIRRLMGTPCSANQAD